MKKNNYCWELIKLQMRSTLVKIFISVLLFFIIYYVAVAYRDLPYWEAFTAIITNSTFLALCLVPFILFIQITFLHRFQHNEYLVFRFPSKRHFMNRLLMSQIILTSLLYGIVLILIATLLNFLSVGNFVVNDLAMVKMDSFTFFLFSTFKLYGYLLLFGVLNSLFLQCWDQRWVIVGNMILCSCLFFGSRSTTLVFHWRQIPLFIHKDLTMGVYYDQVYFHYWGTLFHFTCLLLFFFIIYQWIMHRHHYLEQKGGFRWELN